MEFLIALFLVGGGYSLYAAILFHEFGDELPKSAADDIIGHTCLKFWRFFGLFRS
jgi:hypothetical protein